MLPFREIAIEDKGAIEEKFNLEPARMTERCFTDAFIWRCRYRTLFAIQGDFLFMLSMGEEAEVLTYLFPLGKGDRRLALDAIAQDAAQRGKPYRILACSPEQKAEVEALLPGRLYRGQGQLRLHLHQRIPGHPQGQKAPLQAEFYQPLFAAV